MTQSHPLLTLARKPFTVAAAAKALRLSPSRVRQMVGELVKQRKLRALGVSKKPGAKGRPAPIYGLPGTKPKAPKRPAKPKGGATSAPSIDQEFRKVVTRVLKALSGIAERAEKLETWLMDLSENPSRSPVTVVPVELAAGPNGTGEPEASRAGADTAPEPAAP